MSKKLRIGISVFLAIALLLAGGIYYLSNVFMRQVLQSAVTSVAQNATAKPIGSIMKSLIFNVPAFKDTTHALSNDIISMRAYTSKQSKLVGNYSGSLLSLSINDSKFDSLSRMGQIDSVVFSTQLSNGTIINGYCIAGNGGWHVKIVK